MLKHSFGLFVLPMRFVRKSKLRPVPNRHGVDPAVSLKKHPIARIFRTWKISIIKLLDWYQYVADRRKSLVCAPNRTYPDTGLCRSAARHEIRCENGPEDLSLTARFYDMVSSAAVQEQDHSAPSQQAVGGGPTVLRQ
jgi:hypothetical protein